MKETKNNSNISWFLVIICLIIFWPLGLYLTFKKLFAPRPYTQDFGPAQPQPQPQPQHIRPVFKPKKSPSKLLLIGGVIFLIIGISMIGNALEMIFWGYFDSYEVYQVIQGLFYCAGGAALFLLRGYIAKRNRLFQKYVVVIGDRSAVSIKDIAGTIPVPFEKACQDLQRMIDQGYFGPEAFLDMRIHYLLKSGRAYAEVDIKPEPEKTERPEPEKTDEFQAILRDIRNLNDEIDDETLSAQIDLIEQITAQIFRTVKDKPEKMPQIRSFLNYYLPTTLKLLHAYSQMERQGIAGQNISSTKENIERIIARLVIGYQRQLDQLYRSDAIDISSDIDVLERMMSKDGLSDDYTMKIDL